ncbi:hypothetical protein MMC30_003157 [Trapelia coarctata]|nr:hypothetical protein [Trapelia coarctata]
MAHLRRSRRRRLRPPQSSVRIYYLPQYLAPPQLTRLLTDVPYICTSGDSRIVCQNGKTYHSLKDVGAEHPYFLTPKERRLARNKCIASVARVFAVGGYKTPLRPLRSDEVLDAVVVSGAGPQFEAEYLNYADFFLSEDGKGGVLCARLPEYEGLGAWPGRWEDVLRACAEEKGKAEGEREFVLFAGREVEGYPRSNGAGEWVSEMVGRDSYVFHEGAYLRSMRVCVGL